MNDVWFVLQDANFNVLGLTDSGGELVEQRTYDPYGELLTRESFAAHPGFKAGHQGLFFDRLEPPAPLGGSVSLGEASQLEPNTFGIYQVRNRVLLPRYGRWAQKDPNASGMLHASLWHDGQSPSPDLAAGSLDAMLGDGANLFAFVSNNPFDSTDPIGLMISVFAPASTLDLQVDWSSNVLDAGREAQSNVDQTYSGYADDQMAFVEWALDMTLPHDIFWSQNEMESEANSSHPFAKLGAHSASKATKALKTSKSVKTATKSIKQVQAAKKNVMPYKKAVEYTKGHGGRYQAHHLIERRHKHLFKKLDTDDFPSVILNKNEHIVVTAKLRKVMPYGTKIKSKKKLIENYEKAYSSHPEYIKSIKKYLNEK